MFLGFLDKLKKLNKWRQKYEEFYFSSGDNKIVSYWAIHQGNGSVYVSKESDTYLKIEITA